MRLKDRASKLKCSDIFINAGIYMLFFGMTNYKCSHSDHFKKGVQFHSHCNKKGNMLNNRRELNHACVYSNNQTHLMSQKIPCQIFEIASFESEAGENKKIHGF